MDSNIGIRDLSIQVDGILDRVFKYFNSYIDKIVNKQLRSINDMI